MKILAVTGTPGTGKTAIAKKLSLVLHYEYISGSELIKTAKLARGYDKKRRVPIVEASLFTREVLKLAKSIAKTGKKGVIVDSHMSHFLPSKRVFACIVASCSLKTLARRLTKRGYSSSKLRENLDSEIFDICLTEALEMGHNVVKVDTTQKVDYKSLLKSLKIRT